MEALGILFGALFTVAVAWRAGGMLLGGERGCDPGARFVSGAAVVSLAMFALCCAGWVYPLVLLAMGAAAGAARRPARPKFPLSPWRQWQTIFCLLFVTFSFYFVLSFFNAMAPETSFDGAGYHLGLVARYLREHGFHRLTWNLYASLTQGVEMLYLMAFAFGRHSAASLLHFAFLVALAWQVFTYGRRAGFAVAGACAALLVFASPMMVVDGTSAYIDVAVAAIVFTLFHLLHLWEERPAPRLLAAIGVVAGFAFAAKYTAWPAIPYALAFVAWKSRRARPVLTVAAGAALMTAPWLVKNWLWTGDPLAPFFNRWFPNPYVTAAFEEWYRHYYGHYDLASLWQIPWQVTVHGHLGGLFGPVFLLAPVALVALRRREGRRLLFAAAVFGVNYFANIGSRFLISSVSFVALAMLLALASVPRLAVAMVLIHAWLSWPTRVARYCAPDAWHVVRVPWRQALRIKSPDEYLRTNMFFYDVARMIDRATPEDATVFTYRPIPESYTSRRVLLGYESEPNQIVGVMIQAASFPTEAPALRIRFGFPRQTLAAVRLATTNTADIMWRIHELRVAAPLARVSASSYPWTAPAAVDASAITFWRAGETLRPGEKFTAEFSQATEIDGVTIETSPDQVKVKLRLEGRDAAGVWRDLSEAPAMETDPAPTDLRAAAIEQAKRAGISYLLSFEGEGETADLRAHADLWGIREVARNRDARLYKLP